MLEQQGLAAATQSCHSNGKASICLFHYLQALTPTIASASLQGPIAGSGNVTVRCALLHH